jgi:hypothetical protein
MSSMLCGPTDTVETIPGPEVADLGLGTRFGSGLSALSPFEETRDRAGARLGELLVSEGVLSAEQLEWALAEQAKSGRLLGEIVVQNGLVSMVALLNALVQQLRDGPDR